MATFHHHTRFFKSTRPPLRCSSPLPRNLGRLTCDTQSSDGICCTRKRGRNTGAIAGPLRTSQKQSFPHSNRLPSNSPPTKAVIYERRMRAIRLTKIRLLPSTFRVTSSSHKPSIYPSSLRRLARELLVRLSRILNSHFPSTLSRHPASIIDLTRTNLYHWLMTYGQS